MAQLITLQIDEIKEFITKQSLVNKEVMNLSEASIFMGVSKSYLYKLTSNREIPFSKPREKLIFFKKSDLESWMLQHRVATKAELAEMPLPRSGKAA